MRVLLTGATGFVGAKLCDRLVSSGYRTRVALRKSTLTVDSAVDRAFVGDIGSETDWRSALPDIDAVVHVAARAHVLKDGADRSHLYEETNALGTRRLAEAAVAAGVRRFVYLSTVKVNGEETTGTPYSAQDVPRPVGAYAISKWHGEQYLLEIAQHSQMEVAIIRSPLVYGPSVRANFLRLLKWVDRRLPLPFGSVRNSRSMVNVWNLVDLVTHVLSVTTLPGHTWMVSDGEDLSTPELVRRVGHSMNRDVRLVAVPVRALEHCARLLGRRDEVRRLCGSLVVDSNPVRRLLRWSPPVSVDAAIARTVSWYLSRTPQHAS